MYFLEMKSKHTLWLDKPKGVEESETAMSFRKSSSKLLWCFCVPQQISKLLLWRER